MENINSEIIMSWQYIAGFFDGEGNLLVGRRWHRDERGEMTSYAYQVIVRLYNTHLGVLEKIKSYIGYGNLYRSKRGVYELNIKKKLEVRNFIFNISDYLIIKKDQVNYLKNNYSFNIGHNNNSFDVKTFRGFVKRKVLSKNIQRKEVIISNSNTDDF